ncbi:MAG: hypothetical protein MJZ61_00405 [Bacteroidales bacterium]|nr:hypothetical protein [Bacteroidales bacterium]
MEKKHQGQKKQQPQDLFRPETATRANGGILYQPKHQITDKIYGKIKQLPMSVKNSETNIYDNFKRY